MKYEDCEICALFSDKVEMDDIINMCKDIVKTARDKQVLGDTWS